MSGMPSLASLLLLKCLICCLLVSPARASFSPIAQFKVFVLCKPHVDIPNVYSGSMTPQEIQSAREAFTRTWPQMIKDLSDGQVLVEVKFVVSGAKVTRCAKSQDPSARPCVWPEHVAAQDLTQLTRGEWDAVICYNAIPEFQYVASGAEVTPAKVSWISINKRADLGYNQDALAGVTHEFLHSWESYYYNFCKHPNRNAAVHDGGKNSYKIDSGGLPFWLGWHRDLMMGKVQGTNGFGPQAWTRLGTPRNRFKR